MKHGVRAGANHKKLDPSICMVVDCHRKALYRSTHQATRGYCSAHRDFAVNRWAESTNDSMANRLTRGRE